MEPTCIPPTQDADWFKYGLDNSLPTSYPGVAASPVPYPNDRLNGLADTLGPSGLYVPPRFPYPGVAASPVPFAIGHPNNDQFMISGLETPQFSDLTDSPDLLGLDAVASPVSFSRHQSGFSPSVQPCACWFTLARCRSNFGRAVWWTQHTQPTIRTYTFVSFRLYRRGSSNPHLPRKYAIPDPAWWPQKISLPQPVRRKLYVNPQFLSLGFIQSFTDKEIIVALTGAFATELKCLFPADTKTAPISILLEQKETSINTISPSI